MVRRVFCNALVRPSRNTVSVSSSPSRTQPNRVRMLSLKRVSEALQREVAAVHLQPVDLARDVGDLVAQLRDDDDIRAAG